MSAVVRAGYKLTEVGVIPGDWEVMCVGVAFDVCNHLRLPISQVVREQMIGDYPYYGPTNVQGWINEFRVEGEYALIGEDGDHFLKWRTQSMTLLVRGRFNVNNHAHLVRGLRNHTEWFYWYFANRDITASLTRQGASRYKLNKATLVQLPCALPQPYEQRAIATALSDVDALLTKLDALIAKKRDLKVATMQQLLTGQTRLPGFSGAWEVKRLGDVLSRMANGAVYKPIISLGIQITRIETIADGAIDYLRTGVAEYTPELERYKLIPGDILFSHINSVDHIGKVAIFNGEQLLYHGMNLLLLRTNKDADSSFLYFWFTSLPARRQTRNLAKQAVSQASINTKELKALEILLPPMPEQTAIATLLCDMDTELTALEARRDKTRALKQGMMQVLLTGEIRLL